MNLESFVIYDTQPERLRPASSMDLPKKASQKTLEKELASLDSLIKTHAKSCGYCMKGNELGHCDYGLELLHNRTFTYRLVQYIAKHTKALGYGT